MKFLHRYIWLFTQSTALNRVLTVFNTKGLPIVSIIVEIGCISRFATEKKISTPVRKDTENGPSKKTIRTNRSVVLNEGKSKLDVCYNEKLSADHPTLGVHISQVVSRKRPVCEAEFVTTQGMGWSFISLIANGFQMRKIKIVSVTNLGGKLSPRPYCNFNGLIGVS